MSNDQRAALLEFLGGRPDALDEKTIELLRRDLRISPHETLLHAPTLLGPNPTIKAALKLLETAENLLQQPEKTLATLRANLCPTVPMPPKYQFPGYDPNEIAIKPGMQKYEKYPDAPAWVLTAAMAWVWRRFHSKPPFIRHSNGNKFIYPLGTEPKKLALFSDWANGYYHAAYIAKHVTDVAPDYVFHLGDVYYTGRKFEVRDYLEKPLEKDILPKIPFFALNANHEMESWGTYYFDFLKKKRTSGGQNGFVEQPQEGSYFCLQANHYQVIGIDTAFFKEGRHRDSQTQAWLADRLAEGKANNQINILLSQNGPYNKGSEEPASLLRKDLDTVRENIDLWFWGDHHYAALYDEGTEAPFYGSCIGHGGYPYYTLNPGDADNDVAPTIWEETDPRFPADFDGVDRRDVGSNGWCLVTLESSQVSLTYYDWLRRERYAKIFNVQNGGLAPGM